MDTASSVALVTAVIAGFVALIGYFLSQATNRRERKSKVYAEALLALRQYQELPFKIRRRSSSDSATREALGREWSEVLSNLIFYLGWLQIESPVVGRAYDDLFEQTRKSGKTYWTMAWKQKVFERDEQMTDDLHFKYDNQPEINLCLKAMRRELSMWSFAFRHSTSTALTLQRQARAEEGEQ